MRRSAHVGFSLVELMVTLTVASIIVALVVPNLRDFLRNGRLTGAVNDMLHSFNVARTEAIKRQNGNVVVCGSTAPTAANPVCTYDTFAGWIVFADTNANWQHDAGEPVLEVHQTLDASVTVKTDANNDIVSYNPTGFANLAAAGLVPTATLVVCDKRGVVATGVQSTARALFISPTGRARTSNLQADITGKALPSIVGLTCP